MIKKLRFKYIRFILLITSVIFLGTLFSPKSVFAAPCGGTPSMDMYLCSSNGNTVWGVNVKYYNGGTDALKYSNSNLYASLNGAGGACSASTDKYAHIPIDNYVALQSDYLIWHTACVDPTSPANTDRALQDPCVAWGDLDISCYSVSNAKYAGCIGWSYNNSGLTISSSAQCPYKDTTDSYCTKAGVTAYNAVCGNSYCGGTNNCTYFNKTCSGTSCSHPATAYSTMCGNGAASNGGVGSSTPALGAADFIPGTAMCGSGSGTNPNGYSIYCSPPSPNLTATGACDANANPIINTSYSSRTGGAGNGNYDLRWKLSTSSTWTNVCSPGASSYRITAAALDYGKTYDVQVREHTDSGINGPTNFRSDTATIPWCNWALTAHVFVDNNGTGSQGATDPDYNSNGVNLVNFSGLKSANLPTNSAGDAVVSSIAAGTETAGIITANLPAGWVVSPATVSPVSKTGPPNQLVSFGIRPPAPTCAGGLTVTTPIYQGKPSTVRCVTPTSPYAGQSPVYNWSFTPDPTFVGPQGSITNVTTSSTATYTAAASAKPNGYTVIVNLSICNPGGGLCTNYSQQITVSPLFTLTGYVYQDLNKNGLKDAGEPLYTSIGGEISISPVPPAAAGSTLSNPGTGNFTITNVPQGNYSVSYAATVALSQGYFPTSPSGTPPTYNVTLAPCSVGGSSANPPCLATGDINPLGFGISNSIPWMQSIGGDFYQNGFYDPIPVTAISNNPPTVPSVPYGGAGRYASVFGIGGTTPGIIYRGNQNGSFGPAGSSASFYNWVVGGTAYPEVYASTGIPFSTSYGLIDSLVDTYNKRADTTVVKDLASVCDLTNCSLDTVTNGIYYAYSDLTLTNSTISGNKNLIILVGSRSVGVNTKTDTSTTISPRNLIINGPVHVNNGSTLLITVKGNININSNVGEAQPETYCQVPQGPNAASTGCDIEGYYSTDQSFNIQKDPANACPTPDLRFNIGGSIVTGAAGGGGSLAINRDLCAGGSTYPVFSITERPDFILNSPDFFKTQRRVWQEVAP